MIKKDNRGLRGTKSWVWSVRIRKMFENLWRKGYSCLRFEYYISKSQNERYRRIQLMEFLLLSKILILLLQDHYIEATVFSLGKTITSLCALGQQCIFSKYINLLQPHRLRSPNHLKQFDVNLRWFDYRSPLH